MSTIDFKTLNTAESFKAFLREYHASLSMTRSFPPLGLQKALHTAAPVFGFHDWHVMSAALENSTQAATHCSETVALPSDEELDAMALSHGFKFHCLAGARWDWSDLNGDIESSLAWETKREAWLDLCEVQGIDSRSPREMDAATAAATPAPKETAEPEPIHLITITTTTIDADSQAIEYVDTDIVRSWEAAKESVADKVRSKVMHNDRDIEEALEDNFGVTGPSDEDRKELDSEDDVLEWVLEHNDIDDLCELLSYLDYNLTTVTVKETWI